MPKFSPTNISTRWKLTTEPKINMVLCHSQYAASTDDVIACPTGSANLVDVKFEMNPLDISADNSIRLIAAVKPLRVTYNAVSEHVCL